MRHRARFLLCLTLLSCVTIVILCSYSGVKIETDYAVVYKPADALNVIKWSLKNQLNSQRAIKNNNNRIFFHETSGKTQLSFKDTCAIESAALHNPQKSIEVFLQPNQPINDSSKPYI